MKEELIKLHQSASQIFAALYGVSNPDTISIEIEKDEQYFKIAEQRINARTLFT